MASAPEQHPIVRKLESIADLTPEERQALLDLPMKVHSPSGPTRTSCARATARPGAALSSEALSAATR
jgi:hypothetical protein